MRTIEELRSKIIPLPSRFALAADGEGAISPPRGREDGMTFEDGFPIAYSKDPKGESPTGEYIQRNDMNRLGEIASREALFKEAGGVHTYLRQVSDDANGYPKGAILDAYDGIFLGKVESTESGVRKPFAEDEDSDGDIPLVIPNVIDCPVKDDDDSSDDELPERVLWKSVDWIYGAEEGLFHLDLDYTRAQILPREGGVVKEDSLVVGIDVAEVSVTGSLSPTDIPPLTYDTTIKSADGTKSISWSIMNKGHEGNIIGALMIPWVTVAGKGYNIRFKEVPVITATGGTGNYALSFFAKAGTFFTGQNHIYMNGIDILRHPDATDKNFDPYINWVAIPFKKIIRTLEEAAEA